MAEDPKPVAPPIEPANPTPAPSPSAPSVPEDYEELKAFRAQYEPALQTIAPLWDDYVKPLLEDEQEREFYKAAREQRQRFIDEQKPKLTPELELIRNEFRTELDPIVSYVKSEQQKREDDAKAIEKAAQEANVAYAQRLVAERPDLAEENYAGMHALAALATRDKLSLEDAWKRYGTRLVAQPQRKEPPTSLRGAEAAPGVPGPSSQPRIKDQRGIAARLSQNLRAAGMKG